MTSSEKRGDEMKNKFREKKSYVICGGFFTGRGMYWRSTKTGESTGGAERSGADDNTRRTTRNRDAQVSGSSEDSLEARA